MCVVVTSVRQDNTHAVPIPAAHIESIKAAAMEHSNAETPLSDEEALVWLVGLISDAQTRWTADERLVTNLKQPVSIRYRIDCKDLMIDVAVDVVGCALHRKRENEEEYREWSAATGSVTLI